jgi:hypothetical protein
MATDRPQIDAEMVFVQVAGTVPGAPADWRFPESSQILALSYTDAGDAPRTELLTEDFEAARAPDVSFDGKRMVFAGRRTGENWQIWEMDLGSRSVHRVSSDFAAATEPAYLDEGNIVFSARERPDESFALYACNRRGEDVTRITFHPQDDLSPTILGDGRILFETKDPDASPPRTKLMMVRSDGTGLSLFFGSDPARSVAGRAWSRSGRLFFVESEKGKTARFRIVSVSDARPLHSRRVIADDMEGEYRSLFPAGSGGLLAGYRPARSQRFALYRIGVESGAGHRQVYADPAFDILEPVVVSAREQPLGFMSIVDPGGDRGWLYCLDADHSTVEPARSVPTSEQRIRIIGRRGTIGEFPLERDGSFYVELPANTPLRYVTVDAEGRTVRGPSDWIWIRPNEQRGCIGCHESREFAPENRVPESILKPPFQVERALALEGDSDVVTTAAP